jgi:hypothetical protein
MKGLEAKVATNHAQWFHDQLQASADGLVWAAEQVPLERRMAQPPAGLGEWTAARHLFHMMYYEQHFALPAMRQWLGEPFDFPEILDENEAWGDGVELSQALAGFREVRGEQIALLSQFDEGAWQEKRDTVWGPVTLLWVVSKTYQHTAEHASTILQIALFWDHYTTQAG